MVWSKLILVIFFFTFNLNASELSQEEKDYFNILDLNNNGFVSFDEITQSTNIIFQLIDVNKDNEISLIELEELKKIIGIFK